MVFDGLDGIGSLYNLYSMLITGVLLALFDISYIGSKGQCIMSTAQYLDNQYEWTSVVKNETVQTISQSWY